MEPPSTNWMKQYSYMDENPYKKLSKYGGYHWMALCFQMKGGLPVKMDGTEYVSDDDDDYVWKNDERSVRVSSEEDVENFILACRCRDEDLPRWSDAVRKDARRKYRMESSTFSDEYSSDEVDPLQKPSLSPKTEVEKFFQSATIAPEPVRMKTLCEMLRQGAVVMATELTNYFLIIHIGNDLTSLFKKDFVKCRDNGRCTFTVTNRAFVAQRASRCRTCFGDDLTMAICDNCVACCHKGHDTYITTKNVSVEGENRKKLTISKMLMYCDCGHKLSCKLL